MNRFKNLGVGCFATLLLLLGLWFGSQPVTPPSFVYTPQLSQVPGLPQLEDEATPYFSTQDQQSSSGREVVHRFRADKSVAHLCFGEGNKLSVVWVESEDGSPMYRAEYDDSGRRIKKSWRYRKDGSVETLAESAADGSVKRSFFSAGKLVQEQTLFADGRATTVDYTDSGRKEASSTNTVVNEDRVFWDAEHKQIRLRIQRQGQQLVSWEYFDEKGVCEHTGKALPDGSLEFRYSEKDKLKCRQVWRLVGEDWERPFYQLAYSEAFGDDGVTIEHKVWVRSNGALLRHERFSKTGVLEMRREFDMESRTVSHEEFKEGKSEVHVYQPRTRGFVPDGLRSYPGGNDKIGYVYDLDGKPFQHSVNDPQSWSFFVNAK